MKERLAIVGGVRTPFCKAQGQLKAHGADDLGAYAIKELLFRTGLDPHKIDEVIIGNVIQPPQSANISRILAVKAGIPISIPAYTVNRNCASGMEAITTAANKILAGESDVILCGGAESMSNVPILFGEKMVNIFMKLQKAKTPGAQFGVLKKFRPSFLAPVIPGLTDPLCNLSMGQTAEVLSREFAVTREEQDEFAVLSHNRAEAAIKGGKFDSEIVPVPTPPKYETMAEKDDGVREGQSMADCAKLRPVFDRVAGSVTAGNSSQITDGAAMMLLMTESKAKELGLTPSGYLVDYAYAGLEPNRMGMGPVYATAKLVKKMGVKVDHFDLVEMNEAFAAQVIANEKAFACEEFGKNALGLDGALGAIDRDILNVNGGAIALGHPVGATGARLVMTLLRELAQREKKHALATLCIGGGQGAALALEV